MKLSRNVLEQLSKKAAPPENLPELLREMETLTDDDLLLIVQKKYRLGTKQDLKIGLTLIDTIDGWRCTLKSKSSTYGIWNAQFDGGVACFFEREASLYVIEK